MFKAVAAIAFSLLTLTGAAATEASLYIPYDIDVSITGSVDQPPVEFMGDGIAAERAGLIASFEQTFAPLDAASVDQPAVEFMGDGIAAERAGLVASFEQSFAPPEAEAPAEIEPDLARLEPNETGSLALTAWEEEEPSLVKAYFESRAAYEAMLTP